MALSGNDEMAITKIPPDPIIEQPKKPTENSSKSYTTAEKTNKSSELDPKKAEVRTSVIYKLILSRIDQKNERTVTIIDDINYVGIFRTPMIKMSSYVLMFAKIPQDKVAEIEASINGNFNPLPTWMLTCTEKKDSSSESLDQKIIFDVPLTIVAISRVMEKQGSNAANKTATSIPVRLFLVDPGVKQMMQNTGINKIFSNVTAKGVMIGKQASPESILVSIGKKYYDGIGTNFVDSQKMSIVCCGGSAFSDGWNPEVYEQIVIPSTIKEVNICEYLIDAYKIFPTYGFVFFDSFWRFSHKHNRNRMTCIVYSLHKLKQFCPEYDVTELLDVQRNTHVLGTSPFTDTFNELVKPGATFVFKNAASLTIDKITIGASKIINSVKSQLTTKPAISEASKTVIYSDTLSNARKRIEESVEAITNKIEMFKIFETTNTSPLWLQFGRSYNLDFTSIGGDSTRNTQKYLYTPISIIHVFKRRQEKERNDVLFDHSVKFIALQFTDDTIKKT